jgi:tRNA(Ile)-lysidine synthase TilS/MesJ
MQCSACRHEAIVFQPYSGKHLCPVHFTRDLEAKAKRTIRAHGWLRPGDHIAVVLFGDAASAGLLFFLHSLTKDRRDIRLCAITIDPGIRGSPVGERALAVAEGLGVPWFTGSLVERYGITLDRLIQDEGQEAATDACRVLTCDLLGEIAENHGVTRCAIATSVDEIAGAFFFSLLSGTPEHTLFSRQSAGRSGIPIITPFMEIPAGELDRYGQLHAPREFLPVGPCTGKNSLELDVGEALDTYNRRHPAARFALANLAGTLSRVASDLPPACPVCGEPLGAGGCPACAIREKYRRGMA